MYLDRCRCLELHRLELHRFNRVDLTSTSHHRVGRSISDEIDFLRTCLLHDFFFDTYQLFFYLGLNFDCIRGNTRVPLKLEIFRLVELWIRCRDTSIRVSQV